jgi:lipopolysaccharide biosynthesis glycosyltransferase
MATTPATPATPAGVQPITVVYGVDNRFAIPLAASIQSALDHLGPQYWLEIYIIDGGISRRNRSRLIRSFENRPCRLVWLEPGHGKLAGLKVGGAITIATYYRLLIPQLLPDHAKAIYLDADLIVRRNLADLWSLRLADHHLLAVQDQGVRLISGPFGLRNYRVLQIPEGSKYFNAGVLVLDLEKWRHDGIADTVMTYVSEQAEYIRFHDQDGLNAILWSRWGELDPRWNQMPQILQVRTAADGPLPTSPGNSAVATRQPRCFFGPSTGPPIEGSARPGGGRVPATSVTLSGAA